MLDIQDVFGVPLPGTVVSAIMRAPTDEKQGILRQTLLADAGFHVASAVLGKLMNGSDVAEVVEALQYDITTVATAFWMQWELQSLSGVSPLIPCSSS